MLKKLFFSSLSSTKGEKALTFFVYDFVPLIYVHYFSDNEGVPSTCIREITVLKELNHQNIVTLYDVILQSKLFYFLLTALTCFF